jgi:hypothetical protein
MRQEGALSSEGWQAGLGGGTLLRSEENLARGPQWQSLEGMSGESEEDVTQEKDAGGAVADSVMRGEDEGAVRLLMEQYSAEQRSLIGSERLVYFFGNLPLPPGIGRCNHAERDALAGDATKVGARLKVVSMQAESSGWRCCTASSASRHCWTVVWPVIWAASAPLVGKYWSKRQKSSSKAPRRTE